MGASREGCRGGVKSLEGRPRHCLTFSSTRLPGMAESTQACADAAFTPGFEFHPPARDASGILPPGAFRFLQAKTVAAIIAAHARSLVPLSHLIGTKTQKTPAKATKSPPLGLCVAGLLQLPGTLGKGLGALQEGRQGIKQGLGKNLALGRAGDA